MNTVEKLILNGTEYKNRFGEMSDKLVMSASMFGDEPLVNFLKIVYKPEEKKEEIKETTFGSIFHKGMECIIQENSNIIDDAEVLSEHSMAYDFNDMWTITGTADLILIDKDKNKASVHDFKVTKYKTTTNNKIIEKYNFQLSVLSWLLYKETGIRKVDKSIDFFLKDSNQFKNIPVYIEYPIQWRHPKDTEYDIEEELKTLELYINNAKMPPECSDLWWTKIKGVSTPMRCMKYCGVASVCPYHKKRMESPSGITKQANLDMNAW